VADTPNRERLWAFTPPTRDKAFDDWIALKRTSAIGRILEVVTKYPNSGIESWARANGGCACTTTLPSS
jgi:hypothetical protein